MGAISARYSPSAVHLLNPEALVIAGDMAKAYDILVAGLRESVYGNAIALATRELQILPSSHGDQSGVSVAPQ